MEGLVEVLEDQGDLHSSLDKVDQDRGNNNKVELVAGPHCRKLPKA